MGDRLAQLDQPRNDVLAEIVAGLGVGGVAAQLVGQEFGVEHIDAHAGQRPVRIAGHGRRVGGLLHEVEDAVVSVHVHDAERGRLEAIDLDAAHGHVGALLDVLLQHGLVVHLVDVVPRQHDDEARLIVLDDVQVLEHRVGGAEVPFLVGDPLAGRQDIEALVAFRPEEVPAALHMPDQAVRLVLGGHGDAADAGVQRVGQGEIDDAELAAEEHGRLGAHVGQFEQPAAATAGQHIGHGLAGEGAAEAWSIRHETLSSHRDPAMSWSGISVAQEI